ncbi:MAG: penicillin-binding protein 2 [Sandaracinaceae bacterium]|nr:penicillin-binding protein 2 [Sandaracinaceae bacterium]
MIMLSQRREVGEFRKRYKWFALVAFLAYGALMVRMLSLQVVQADEWSAASLDNITKTLTERATRGIIRDTRGQTIATNRASYTVYATPSLLSDEQIELTTSLMGLTAEDAQAFRRRIQTVDVRRRSHQIRAFADVTRDQVAALEEHGPDLPGIDVVAGPVRQYAFGALGAHTVGYLNEVSAEDLERLADQNYYRAGDRLGRMGIERSLESVLRGRRGFRHVMVNARGRRLSEQEAPQLEGEMHRPAVPGHDVVLTLDMELMRMAQRAFQGHPSGGVVVVDVHSGRIRALYSKPSYDLNELTGRMSQERYNELVENPHRPLIDKTIYDTFFPGSTFKPFSALSALQEGAMDPRERVFCEGSLTIGRQRMRCTARHEDVDMRSALVQSCNVYFWALAERVGLDRLNRYARDFGLAERTGIGINSEARGFLASREWYEEHYGQFRVGYTLNTAIGQGNTRVTLLQLALAYAALANGGVLYAPQLIERIETPDGAVVEEPEPHVRRRLGIDPEHLAFNAEALRGVVNDEEGTAYGALIAGGVSISGKTGTAEVAPGSQRSGDARRAAYFRQSHAWFAGFAPSEDPQVAIVVLVEHGGAGGRNAAPIATRILQEYLAGSVPRTEPARGSESGGARRGTPARRGRAARGGR